MSNMLDIIEFATRNIKSRLLLLLGRGIIKAIDETGGLQKLQCSLLNGETTNGIERMGEYGLSSYPLPDGEVLVGFLGGNRDHGIVVATEDRRHRIKHTNEGDVAIYTYENTGNATGHRILLKKNRAIEIKSNSLVTTVDSDSTKTVGGDDTLTATQDITISAGGDIDIRATGGKVTVDGATIEVLSTSIDIGTTSGASAARVGDATTVNGEHPHSHTIAAGSGTVRIA